VVEEALHVFALTRQRPLESSGRDALAEPAEVLTEATKLAKVSPEYPTAKSVQTKADAILAPFNRDEVAAEGAVTVQQFAEQHFLPWIKERRTASTHKFYGDIVANHMVSVGHIRLRDFRTKDAQAVLDSTPLSHSSLQRIKTGFSALFGYAVRLGFVVFNPIRDTKVEGRRSSFEGHAYSLNDVLWMLERLPEPSRTVVGEPWSALQRSRA
jgi:hypothetical protein